LVDAVEHSARRLVFLNRFFYPDHSATSQILSDLAFHLAASGAEVHVITSQQLYDSPRASLLKHETVNGVHVHRVATTSFGRAALWGRGIDYVSYYASMWWCARVLVREGDVLIAKTDPPLTSIVAMWVALRAKGRLVNWLQDIYPETAAELGVPLMRGVIGRGLGHLRDLSLQKAQANVAVGQHMAQRVRSHGVPSNRMHVIPNWCDDERLCPLPHDENPLRKEWGLQGSFVVGYAGNLGRAHEFQTVLTAAERLRSHPQIVFLFIGGGHRFDQLAGAVRKCGLDRMFRFMAYQPEERLKHALNAADVHLISLKPELEGLIVPSKFYGIAAVGRPMISISARDGEIASLVRQNECGLVVEPGDGQALAKALVCLRDNPLRVAEMGKRARAMLDACFARKIAFGRWQSLLSTVSNPAESATCVSP
jgi:glycosyltransferase involved in cell wall biosynthesis